jgi:hypothetical protein
MGTWDTNYRGFRAPIQEEWLQKIRNYYRETYGENSEEYRTSQSGSFGGGRWPGSFTWEPHVAERMFEELLAAEPRIRAIRGYYPAAVERANRSIRAALFQPFGGGKQLRVSAEIFLDMTYEGDLAAAAGVPYRIGREDRNEYNEIYAGKLWVHRSGNEAIHLYFDSDNGERLRYPRSARSGLLNLRPWSGTTQEILSESTGEGDNAVQAYNFRVTLSRDPSNRIPVSAPEGYRREDFLPIVQKEKDGEELAPVPIKSALLNYPLEKFPAVIPVPNRKCDWNAAAIPGGVDTYPDGDWKTRDAILGRHRNVALGLLYFLQNDPAVPENVRREALEWGLPKDEFADNGHFPREIYIREARRMVGRYVMREQDCCIGRGLQRAPVHDDSIAITEWFMDSHDCTPERLPDAEGDGFTSLSEFSRPSQIPWRSLLPKDIDNLIVGVAISATHAAWGSIRLEPVYMHIAESAAMAAAIAIRQGVPPAAISVDALQRALVESRVMVTFFNEFDMASGAEWAPAVQYLGTKGFFGSYFARPEQPLSEAVALLWSKAVGRMLEGNHNAGEFARCVARAEREQTPGVTGQGFVAILRRELDYRDAWRIDIERCLNELAPRLDAPVNRGEVCRLIYALLDLRARKGLPPQHRSAAMPQAVSDRSC